MKKFLITLFILEVVFSTLSYFYRTNIRFDAIVLSWFIMGAFCLIVFYISKVFSLGFDSLSNSYFGRNKKRKLISKQNEDDAYQLVSDEVRNNEVNDAIWTKLYIKHKGDKKKTEIDYLKERVNEILDETESKKQQALIEQKKKKTEEKATAFFVIIVVIVIILIVINT